MFRMSLALILILISKLKAIIRSWDAMTHMRLEFRLKDLEMPDKHLICYTLHKT